MPGRGPRRLLIVSTILLAGLAAIGVLAYVADSQQAGTARLTIFNGTVTVGGVAATSGRTLHEGDVITTAPAARAGIRFPDGSRTRLDGSGQVRLERLRGAPGSYDQRFFQAAGRTWTNLGRLLGRSAFRVDGPRNTAAEVRGTRFSFTVEPQAVAVSVYDGSVAFSANGGTVTVNAGSTSQVTGGGRPAPPAPISPAERASLWTVFNAAVDASQAAAPTGAVVRVDNGQLAAGQTVPDQPATSGDGSSDLLFTLAWPGSTLELTVVGPDKTVFATRASPQSPVSIRVPQARSGAWYYRVRALQVSAPRETYAVAVAVINGSTEGGY